MKFSLKTTVAALLLCMNVPCLIAQTDALKILDNGNIGIGNTNPAAKLHVGGLITGTALSKTFVTNAGVLGNSAGSELPLANIGFLTGNNTSLGIRALRTNAADKDWFGTAIGIGMDVDNTIRAGGASLWFSANGNIGIGKTTPAVILDVAGDVKADGRIKDKTGFVMPVGAIIAYGGSTAPEGWLLCDGSTINAGYTELRNIVGGNTPDLRSRFIVGAGNGPGLTNYSIRSTGGEERHTLSVAEMPSHNHAGFGEAYDGWPFGNYNSTRTNMGSAGGKDYDNYLYNTTSTGGSQAHENRPPYYALTYIIKY
jgi:microcystin-dependent protein